MNDYQWQLATRRELRVSCVARVAAVAACAVVVAFCGADWRQFRGNDSDGLSADGGPRSLDKTAWSTPLVRDREFRDRSSSAIG